MKLDNLPPELLIEIFKNPSISPLDLLNLGHAKPPLSKAIRDAALDDRMWAKTWSRPELNRQNQLHGHSEAFRQRWALRQPQEKALLKSCYNALGQAPHLSLSVREIVQEESGRRRSLRAVNTQNPRFQAPPTHQEITWVSQDLDLQIVAARAATTPEYYVWLSGNVQFEYLYEPRIINALLSSLDWLKQSLPYNIIRLQTFCFRLNIPIPEMSKTSEIWLQFVPERDSFSNELSPYQIAFNRLRAKPESLRTQIFELSEIARLARGLNMNTGTGEITDFELLMAQSATANGSLKRASLELKDDKNIALWAMGRVPVSKLPARSDSYDPRVIFSNATLAVFSQRLRDDYDWVKKSLLNRGLGSLFYASDRLAADLSLIILACDNVGGNDLENASEQVLLNPEAMIEVFRGVKDKLEVYGWLPEEMRRKKQILAILSENIRELMNDPSRAIEPKEILEIIQDKRQGLEKLGVPEDLIDSVLKRLA